MPERKKARPLISYLVAFAAAMILPPMLLAIVATARWASSEQTKLETGAHERTRELTEIVDRYLSRKIASLQALATSPSIDARDFERLDLQARDLLDQQIANIVLRDPDGQQFINTRLPPRSLLPRSKHSDADRYIGEHLSPYISDIYLGISTGLNRVSIAVPVIRNGAVVYTLSASMLPGALASLLKEAEIAPPYFASLADRNGRIIAGAEHAEALVGKPLAGFQDAPGAEGTWSGINPQGVDVYGVYRRSPLSGWFFSVGVDKAALGAPLYSLIWWLAGLAFALGLVAFVTSSIIGRKLVESHRQLTRAARLLAGGQKVMAPETLFQEANLVGEALQSASTKIRDQAAALEDANRDLEQRVADRTREVSAQAKLIKATLDNMDQGLMVIDERGNIPVCNDRAIQLLDLPPELMAASPSLEAVLRYQLEQDDFSRSGDVLRQWVESGGLEQTHHTYERERPNGTVLEIRTVPLPGGGGVRTFTDITARKSAERAKDHMVRHDSLTGLPNRTLFRERLSQEIAAVNRRGGMLAVLCLDVDRFKVVNDTHGHPAGDDLLRMVADRIKLVVRVEDTVARLGGDEFAILQTGSGQAEAATALARRIHAVIGEPFELEGQVLNAAVSIGVAIGPENGSCPDSLFKNADMALYRAKSEGRNTFRFYDAAMDAAVQAKQALERDLRQALTRGEFELHYQPLVDAADQSISGFEALLRWRHPERGLIQPGEFIPLAESTRLIIPIGEWVLRKACGEAASWPTGKKVAVNISMAQIESPGLVPTVLSALAKAGLHPSQLELEITETVLASENGMVLETLYQLQEMGVRIALDDFGTGYSSLSYLSRFPLNRMKIDRSFVSGIQDRTTAAIVQAIVGLAARLGLAITAEGVETQEQLDFVRREGCTEIQGYFFSRPVPAAEAAALLRKGATKAA